MVSSPFRDGVIRFAPGGCTVEARIMNWLALLVTGALGYVLGSRAGRGPYDRLSKRYEEARHDPRVQERVRQAASFGRYRPREDGGTVVIDAVGSEDRVDG